MALDKSQEASAPTATVLTNVKFKGHGWWYFIQIKDKVKGGCDFYLRQDRHFAELDEALKNSVQSKGGKLFYGSSGLLREKPELPWSGHVGMRLRMSRMGFGRFDAKRQQSLQVYLNQILEQIGDTQKEPLIKDFFREEGHPDTYGHQLQRELVKLPQVLVSHGASNGTAITSSAPVQLGIKEGYEAHPPNFTPTTPFLNDHKGDDEDFLDYGTHSVPVVLVSGQNDSEAKEDDDAQWNDCTRSFVSLCVSLPTNKKPAHPLIQRSLQDEALKEEDEAADEGGAGQPLSQLKQSCSIVVFPSLNASPKHPLIS